MFQWEFRFSETSGSMTAVGTVADTGETVEVSVEEVQEGYRVSTEDDYLEMDDVVGTPHEAMRELEQHFETIGTMYGDGSDEDGEADSGPVR